MQFDFSAPREETGQRLRLPRLADLGLIVTVMFTMVGNARLMELDITLTAILPFCLLMLFLTNPSFSRSGVVAALVLMVVGLLMTYQAARLGHAENYGLWPIKAVLVALFVSAFWRPINQLHFYFVLALVVVFVITSEDIYGRSYGFFGPNMLYRFYGMLFAMACYLLVTGQISKTLCGVAMAIAVVGIVRTGSIGGLVLLGFGVALLLRPTVRTFAALVILSFLVWFFISTIIELTVIQRVLLKASIEEVAASTRFNGLSQLLSYEIAAFGRPRDAYSNVWHMAYDYPHNIFVELVAFFGYIGLVICGVLVWAFWICFLRMQQGRCSVFEFAFIAVFFGANLSGDLTDNYGAVGIAFAMVTSRLLEGRRRQTDPAGPFRTRGVPGE